MVKTLLTHPAKIDHHPIPPFPEQHQDKPGYEGFINPRPDYQAKQYHPAGKLEGKISLITGGDSGIGRAVALIYAREGAQVAISYLPEEQKDAQETQSLIHAYTGKESLLLPGDLQDAQFCCEVIEKTVKHFGKLDILVSNAAYQNRKSLIELTDEELAKTFEINVYAYIRLSALSIEIFTAWFSNYR